MLVLCASSHVYIRMLNSSIKYLRILNVKDLHESSKVLRVTVGTSVWSVDPQIGSRILSAVLGHLVLF